MRLTPNAQSAIIAASAAILAAAVAGLATVYATKTTLSGELRRDREREAVRAAGAARLLSGELFSAAIYMNVMVNDQKFRPLDRNYRISVPPDDLRLLFTYLTANEWGTILLVLTTVQQLETYVVSRRSDGARTLTPRDTRIVRNDYRTVLEAAETLKRAADAQDLDLSVIFLPPEALPD